MEKLRILAGGGVVICERAPIHCLCWVLESPIPPILPIMFTLLCGQCFQFQAFQFPLQSHRLLHSLHPHLPPPSPPALFSKSHNNNPFSSIELPPNALRRKLDPHWRGGFSLGVDLGTSRTGLALSKGFSIRPLTVLELRGQKLEAKLIQIAEQEEADEFIIGLPKSCDGKETPQSNKIRSIAGRVAARAAERGWRVYLYDEHGTTAEAESHMISKGLNKSTRQKKIDAYAAMMVLERYFLMSGQGTELLVPKSLVLQDKLIEGPPTDPDFKD
ncbi:hypothetical protein IC582_012108 [Cucumis melo]|uniref:Uncharacterized protein LOC103483114 isoform X1 n=1 Tax=Cucumis melo TaxID=3656 RepID=A0A1S3AUT7_CUCME|nr:uncharacterized protein LOC103483114 isoform X1 [Cucumis melo]